MWSTITVDLIAALSFTFAVGTIRLWYLFNTRFLDDCGVVRVLFCIYASFLFFFFELKTESRITEH